MIHVFPENTCVKNHLQVPTFAPWMLRVDVLGSALADVTYSLVAMVTNPSAQEPWGVGFSLTGRVDGVDEE